MTDYKGMLVKLGGLGQDVFINLGRFILTIRGFSKCSKALLAAAFLRQPHMLSERKDNL